MFTRTMRTGGTENVVLQLCKIFSPRVNKVIVCSCGGVHVATLEKMGINHYEIPDMESKSPRTILTILKTLKRIIREENITVVHTHHRMAAFYTRLLYNGRFTFFNTSHGVFADKRALTRFAYKKTNLIACGSMVAKNLQGFYGLERVKTIRNAVESFAGERVPDPLITSLREKGFSIVGNVGRFSEEKGVSYFLRAIPRIRLAHPEARFLIAGDGPEREVLNTLVKELGVSDVVFFLGYRSDVQNVMSQMDFLVLPSLSEGLPLIPIEAFSEEKTIVATAVDGTVEIVKDGKNGLLCAPADENDLAEKICWMLEHPAERAAMEDNARACYEKDFSFSRLEKEYVRYYLEILEKNGDS